MDQKNDRGKFGGDCTLCPRYLDCSNLSAAQKIIESKLAQETDQDLQKRYSQMVQVLEKLGLSYPEHQKSCNLADLPDLSRKLVEEAIQLVRDLDRSA